MPRTFLFNRLRSHKRKPPRSNICRGVVHLSPPLGQTPQITTSSIVSAFNAAYTSSIVFVFNTTFLPRKKAASAAFSLILAHSLERRITTHRDMSFSARISHRHHPLRTELRDLHCRYVIRSFHSVQKSYKITAFF